MFNKFFSDYTLKWWHDDVFTSGLNPDKQG